MKKYKPIRIFNIHYGYGYWWGKYFFFIGKNAVDFAIVPMYRELGNSTYYNNRAIPNGDTMSWSESRQEESRQM